MAKAVAAEKGAVVVAAREGGLVTIGADALAQGTASGRPALPGGALGVALVTYSPLASSLLTGKYRYGQPPPPDSRAIAETSSSSCEARREIRRAGEPPRGGSRIRAARAERLASAVQTRRRAPPRPRPPSTARPGARDRR